MRHHHHYPATLALLLALLVLSPAAVAATITVGDPVTSCTPDCDYTTVTAAVGNASDGDTILIEPDTYDEGSMVVMDDLTIKSAGGLVTIDGRTNDNYIFQVLAGTVVTLEDLTLKNPGSSSNPATATLVNHGTTRLSTVSVVGSAGVASLFGGVYNSSHGLLIIEDSSSVSGNNSDDYGGGISNYGALVVDNSTISGNDGELGGGIYNDKGVVAVLSTSISSNTADDKGGGYANVDTSDGTVAIFPTSSFSTNSADVDCDEEYSENPSYLCVD